MTIENLYSLFIQSTGISTDTRKIISGNIFFALKGENFNGNKFARKALDLGAAYVVIDEKEFVFNEKTILVDDVLKTLQQLANFHRRKLKIPVLAICGSNGKTTTKELIKSVLETQLKVFATQGNFNNHIGVPLSILSLKKENEFAVLELGANHLLETKLLCEIAEPDFGLITNNGKDHLEGYGSLENIKKGNGELYDFLQAENKLAFVCADERDLIHASSDLNRVTYGTDIYETVQGKIISSFPFLKIECSISNSSFEIKTNLVGDYNLPNVLAAICVGNYFGISIENMQRGIENYFPSNNRSQMKKIGNNIFILDCYNANPSSMSASVKSFSDMEFENKIAVLGDMAELGNASEEEHQLMIEFAEHLPLQKIIFCGNNFFQFNKKQNEKLIFFSSLTDTKKFIREQNYADAAFLLKASRTVGLEKIIDEN